VTSFRPELQPIARAVYIQFQEFAVSGILRFRKSDPVVKTLSMDRDDLDEALLNVANQFGCRKPTAIPSSTSMTSGSGIALKLLFRLYG
jgi:hypothetical protein